MIILFISRSPKQLEKKKDIFGLLKVRVSGRHRWQVKHLRIKSQGHWLGASQTNCEFLHLTACKYKMSNYIWIMLHYVAGNSSVNYSWLEFWMASKDHLNKINKSLIFNEFNRNL